MKDGLSPEDKSAICDMVSGTVDGFEKALHEFSIEVDDLEELLLNNGFEKCPDCEWFVETHELIPYDLDEPDGHCDNCRP